MFTKMSLYSPATKSTLESWSISVFLKKNLAFLPANKVHAALKTLCCSKLSVRTVMQ